MRSFLLVVSHVMVAVVGWFLAHRDSPDKGSGLVDERGNLAAPSSQNRVEFRRVGSVTRAVEESDRFQTYWNLLPDEKLSTKDRIAAQRRILKEWSLVDLEAAMKAMLAESWWAGPKPYGINVQLKGPFASAFAEAFSNDPEGSWDLITSGELGMGASMLRQAWYGAMRGEPLVIAGKLPEVPVGELREVIRKLGTLDLSEIRVREGVIAALKEMPESKVSIRQILPFLAEVTRGEALERFKATTDFSTREGEIALYQHARFRFIGEKFEGLRSHGAEVLQDIREVNELLPQKTQGRFLYGLLAGSFESQTNGGTTEERSLDLLNLMVEGEHWEQVDKAQSLTVISQGYGLSPESRVGWAATLPEREELVGVFDDSIKSYLNKNEETAMDWIGDLPEGMWRDRSLAAYSEKMLGFNGQLEKSREAIAQIQDPVTRKAAEDNHAIYAKARGLDRR